MIHTISIIQSKRLQLSVSITSVYDTGDKIK
jgi:hypothetical protein